LSCSADTAELPFRSDEAEMELELGPTSGISPGPARRVLDIAVAALILGLTLPLLLFLVLASRLSTGGSAIYRQRRVGQGGIPFTLYKFRTMRLGVAGPEVTAPGDHRVTRLGAVLRGTSIDELPQMVNVLLGHMTLVGPRPESVALAARYPAEFKLVFQYRPGVTGPSQVLVRDEKVLGHVLDVEDYYLRNLVPHRVATDFGYLNDPTLVHTVRWLVDTALYLIGVIKPKLVPAQPPPDSTPPALNAPADD
jgi:lipopolysaccharide/colanic/teichoic acid biosynthesis glycosyltransferase